MVVGMAAQLVGWRRAAVGRGNVWSVMPFVLGRMAGAVVGGALWSGLTWWSGGVLAARGSHILWTGLMLARPPGAARRGTATT